MFVRSLMKESGRPYGEQRSVGAFATRRNVIKLISRDTNYTKNGSQNSLVRESCGNT